MARLARLFCAIALVLTVGLAAAAPDGVTPAVAQEQDALATPPADIQTPPDKIETSEGIDWSLLGLLGVGGLAGLIPRRTRIVTPTDRSSGTG